MSNEYEPCKNCGNRYAYVGDERGWCGICSCKTHAPRVTPPPFVRPPDAAEHVHNWRSIAFPAIERAEGVEPAWCNDCGALKSRGVHMPLDLIKADANREVSR